MFKVGANPNLVSLSKITSKRSLDFSSRTLNTPLKKNSEITLNIDATLDVINVVFQ
jgi:hypothetical protein